MVIESDRFDVILTFNKYHPLDVSAADWLLPLAAQHNVGVLNGSPMAHGLLTGQDPEKIAAQRKWGNIAELLPDAKVLYAWRQQREVSMAAVIFQFCLRQPLVHCSLTGAKTRAELESNLRAATQRLPDDIWAELAALDITHVRYGGRPNEEKSV